MGRVEISGVTSARSAARAQARVRDEWRATHALGVANEPRHAITAKLAGFSFRRATTQEIARKHSFSLRTTNWISAPLCNDAADKLYRRAIKISTFCTLLLLYFMETLLSRTCIRR